MISGSGFPDMPVSGRQKLPKNMGLNSEELKKPMNLAPYNKTKTLVAYNLYTLAQN